MTKVRNSAGESREHEAMRSEIWSPEHSVFWADKQVADTGGVSWAFVPTPSLGSPEGS